MKRLSLTAAIAALAALTFAGSASAAPLAQVPGVDVDTTQAVVWSIVGVAIFCLAGGILYLFKRQVGGFPENPEWVAPISIMRSSELPSEEPAGPDHAPAHH